MNWSSLHILFPFSSTACPKQSAYSFYHTSNILSSELFLNNIPRSLSISRSVSRFPLFTSFLNSRSRATALLLYHAFLHLSSTKKLTIIIWYYLFCTYEFRIQQNRLWDTPPEPVSSYSYSCSHLSSFSAICFKYISQAAACCFVRFVSDTISP